MQEKLNLYDYLTDFENYLYTEEKSRNTIEKYVRDIKAFLTFLDSRRITKAEVLTYKEIITSTYAPASVNSMLASVNAFL